MRNDTLRKKLKENIRKLEAKIAPFQSEIAMYRKLIAEMEAHESAEEPELAIPELKAVPK